MCLDKWVVPFLLSLSTASRLYVEPHDCRTLDRTPAEDSCEGFSQDTLDVEPITVERSHIDGNYQSCVKLIRRLGTEQGNM